MIQSTLCESESLKTNKNLIFKSTPQEKIIQSRCLHKVVNNFYPLLIIIKVIKMPTINRKTEQKKLWKGLKMEIRRQLRFWNCDFILPQRKRQPSLFGRGFTLSSLVARCCKWVEIAIFTQPLMADDNYSRSSRFSSDRHQNQPPVNSSHSLAHCKMRLSSAAWLLALYSILSARPFCRPLKHRVIYGQHTIGWLIKRHTNTSTYSFFSRCLQLSVLVDFTFS